MPWGQSQGPSDAHRYLMPLRRHQSTVQFYDNAFVCAARVLLLLIASGFHCSGFQSFPQPSMTCITGVRPTCLGDDRFRGIIASRVETAFRTRSLSASAVLVESCGPGRRSRTGNNADSEGAGGIIARDADQVKERREHFPNGDQRSAITQPTDFSGLTDAVAFFSILGKDEHIW
jgi:hypothetical protein